MDDGRLAGYVDLTPQAEGSRFWIDLRVPASQLAVQIADALLAAMEARVGELAAPAAIVKSSAPSVDDLATNALRARGYELFRHSFQMRLDLRDELEAPNSPDGITVRSFQPGCDDEVVYEVVQETFADGFEYVRQTYEEWRAYAFLGAHDPSLWFLAEEGADVAGICLCRSEWAGDTDLGWVNDLGVRRPWRRKGLGLALLMHSFAELRARGNRQVGLGVDGLNPTGAVRLYERAGMHVARRWDQYKKPLAS